MFSKNKVTHTPVQKIEKARYETSVVVRMPKYDLKDQFNDWKECAKRFYKMHDCYMHGENDEHRIARRRYIIHGENMWAKTKFSRFHKKQRAWQRNRVWVRDLTEEGVEPNPGPTVQSMKAQCERAENELLENRNVTDIFGTIRQGPDTDFNLNYGYISGVDARSKMTKAIEFCLNEVEDFLDTNPICNWFSDFIGTRTYEAEKPGYFDVYKLRRHLLYSSGSNISPSSVWFNKCGKEYHQITNTVEAILLFMWQYPLCKTKTDKAVCIASFAKHMDPNGSLLFGTIAQTIAQMFTEYLGFQIQSDDERKSWVEHMRSVLTKYEFVKDSDLTKKIYKFSMYALSLSLFENIGLHMDKLKFSKLEQEAIKRKYNMGPDFIHCILDTIVFLLERGQQFLRTGSMDAIFHDGDRYAEWFDKTRELRTKSNLVSNPEPHGFTIFDYQADLADVIDQGDSIIKHAKVQDRFLCDKIRSIHADMKLLLANQTTKRSAMESRRAPFASLVYGGSSVGKSTFKSIMIDHFVKTFSLPAGDEYIYTRNSADEYVSGFVSSMHTYVLDDVAQQLPTRTPNGDPTLIEIIQLVNSTPWITNQAALEDKGKVPVKVEHVVATTNVKDMNVYFNYSCPLAVLRRLPIVIQIAPKSQYSKDGVMLDGSLVPPVEEGEYPDFWKITVYRVVPGPKKGDSQQAEYRQVLFTESIYKFLQFYAEAATAFRDIQNKEQNSKDNFKTINLCKKCSHPASKCMCVQQVQAHDEHHPFGEDVVFTNTRNYLDNRMNRHLREHTGIDVQNHSFSYKLRMWITLIPVYLYVTFFMFRFFMHLFFGRGWVYRWIYRTANYDAYKILLKKLGARVKRQIGYSYRYDRMIKSGMYYGTLIAGLGLILNHLFKSEESDQQVQGTINSKEGVAPKASNKERENVWYKDDYETTNFDVSPVTSSQKGLGYNTVLANLENNCVSVVTHLKDEGMKRTTSGVCIGGHIYMFNNHGIPKTRNLDLFVISQTRGDGVNNNLRFKVVEDQIKRYPEKDLCFIKIDNLPPRKNIVPLFMQDSLKGVHKGHYLTRERTGAIIKREIVNIKPTAETISDLNITTTIWKGTVKVPTSYGDCGSMMISDSNVGPIILGVHVVGMKSQVGALRVSNQFLEKVVASYDTPMIQSGLPSLNTPTVKRPVTKLHFKSTVRFVEEGTASTFCSFDGFRPAHRSSVKRSILCDSMERRGYKLHHGAPVMGGWEPWRIALLDMVNPVTQIDQSVLDHCVDSFCNDIFTKLSTEDLESVQVYDDFTAINGAAGISYVDKINRNSSAGFPWKKSKKFYTESIPPCNGMMDPVTFDDEIMQRMIDCMDCYKRGERYMPVFTGHLKDEAVSFSKIERKKTRVFTGAPLDYTLVVRKYLLSIIRLMQNNRFIFECGPGTIAQSLEWQEIHNFITKFGKDRMVAGDYKAFDKSMPSQVILAAFKIIYKICEKAGYSTEELTVVQAIAEDTAFPVVDFNGDLMQFYGSNPSGHPLTVIINGLANSLYIRYCYSIMNPERHCRDFQDNVALMTYGDDNVMGINENCSFMNHTTIQTALAQVGITYTMADKEAASIPYIHIDDVSFLKRTWRWDKDIGALVAPLERDSIEKMLMINVESKTIPPEAQAIATISSAIREYFWYGKEEFYYQRKLLQELIDENKLNLYQQDNTLPEWEALRKSFWEASRHVKL